MDPPNVLWFFGAFSLGFAVYVLIEALPTSQRGLWILVAAVAFLVGFAAAAVVLLREGWWVPGGLAAALAVAVFPAVAVSFLTLIGVWPSGPFFEPFGFFVVVVGVDGAVGGGAASLACAFASA